MMRHDSMSVSALRRWVGNIYSCTLAYYSCRGLTKNAVKLCKCRPCPDDEAAKVAAGSQLQAIKDPSACTQERSRDQKTCIFVQARGCAWAKWTSKMIGLELEKDLQCAMAGAILNLRLQPDD